MVRETKSLFQVANELDLGLTARECALLEKDKEFQTALRTERLRYWKELAQDPERSKSSAIGQLLYLADLLTNKEQYDKAANVIMSVAKMEGWLDEKNQINVFADLSAKDFVNMREKLRPKVNAVVN